MAIGQGSYSGVETSIALGSESVSSRVIVKGSRNTSVSEEGVVIGYDTTDGELLGALSIGDDGKYRQIINVADGSEAHDAVTVRQLQNAIGAVATTPTKYYHANSTAEDSLAVGEDSLAMGAKTIVNGNAGIGIGLNTLVLADAINGIAIGSNARANHADSIAMGNGSQTTRGAQTNYTAYNMDAPQNSVGEFSVGSEDGQRQITNVAAGSADTDAVNVGQLKVTDAQVSQNAKLSNAECYLLLTTFKYSAPRGKEKEAVSKILVISQRRGIAKQYCKGTTFVGFENYLDYLKKRARVS